MKFNSLTALITCVFASQATAVAFPAANIQELAARGIITLPPIKPITSPTGSPPPPPPPPPPPSPPHITFNVAPLGTYCGQGTSITCSSSGCKGNFTPTQASIIVTHARGNCHISLYPKDNQQGGVIQRLNTDTTGTCIYTSVAEYQSYGIYCD